MAVAERRPEFTVSFEGPAIDESNRMDVNDLAPSLIALGEVFHRANDLTSPAAPRVNLEIKAFRPGSFEIWLSLQQAGESAEQLLEGHPVQSVISAATLIGIVTGGFKLVRSLRNRAIAKEDVSADGTTRLTLQDGDVIETTAQVVVIVVNTGVRAQMEKVVAPLSHDGIERLRIEPPNAEEAVIISEADYPSYELPPEGESDPITVNEFNMSLSLVSISFTDDNRNKWRLSDGERGYWVSIEDEDFNRRIQAGAEAFRKGDILRCRVRQSQWQTRNGLRTEYAVIQVVEHVAAPTYEQLDWLVASDRAALPSTGAETDTDPKKLLPPGSPEK